MSTTNVVFDIHTRIVKALDQENPTCSVFSDFSQPGIWHSWLSHSRPVIKENTTCVAAASQDNVLLLWHVILNHAPYYGKWLAWNWILFKENNKVRNDDIKSQKNLACFQTYGTDV